MIGIQTMTLSNETVREALEEYVNRHFRPEHARKVTMWRVDSNDRSSYSAPVSIEVTLDANPDYATP